MIVVIAITVAIRNNNTLQIVWLMYFHLNKINKMIIVIKGILLHIIKF